MNALQAANRVKRYLVETRANREDDVSVLTGKRLDTHGFYISSGTGRAQVVCEGDYDWPQAVSEALWRGELSLPDFWVEPATGYALSIYRRRAD